MKSFILEEKPQNIRRPKIATPNYLKRLCYTYKHDRP